MPDCFLTAAKRSGHQTAAVPKAPLWLRLRRFATSVTTVRDSFRFSTQARMKRFSDHFRFGKAREFRDN